MAEAQYNFTGIPDAPAGGYNFAGIPDVTPDIIAHAEIPTSDQITAAEKNPKAPNTLAWYNDPTAGAYHKMMDAVVEHLPTIFGATGGIVGSGLGPLGAVGLAGLSGAAGEAYKELINRARGKAIPEARTDRVLQMAKEAVKQGGAQAVGEAAGPLMTKLGERVMQSAVKPSLKLLMKTAPGETPQVVKTLLDDGVNVTPGGVQRLRALLNASNDEIDAALAPHMATEIPALKVAGRLTDTAKRFSTQVNAQSDLAAISQVGENFLDNPAVTTRGTLTLANAQAMKRGTYAQIGSKYGVPNASATIAAEKALARGLKEDIAAEVPDLASLNAREGKLLEALNAVGKRVALAGNRDPIGFAWVAHSPTTFLAALLDRSPAVKSLLARGLYNAAGTTAKVSPQLIRVAVAALASENPDAGLDASSSDRGNPR